MSKFLSETGLKYFWEKIKTHLSGNYLSLDGGTMNNEASVTLRKANSSENTTTTITGDSVDIKDNSTSVAKIDKDGMYVGKNKSISIAKTAKLSDTALSITYDDGHGSTMLAGVSAIDGIQISDNNGNNAGIHDDFSISGKKFVKDGGTASQVLLANGSIATLNAANGIPKLDANGRIPLSQLGNLDTTLFEVVTALPTTGIKKNRIYLLKANTTGTQNLYAEYIYTGDVSATYDASEWEKLGEYKSDVDLSNYSTNSQTIRDISYLGYSNEGLVYVGTRVDSSRSTFVIPYASSPNNNKGYGLISTSKDKALTTLIARYPLSIASFTASPSLVEVGVSADITFAWTFNNTDFHPITNQGIVVDGAASVSVDKSTKSYKKTGLAGATSATTKSATLTVNGSLTKSVNVTYHYPTYIGVVANGTSITETVVKGLTKSIEWGKGKSATLTQSNQQIVYAYPASYGDLTSIKDGNGFEGFAGYTKSTLTVGGQTYNVYKQTLPATASSKYTFA